MRETLVPIAIAALLVGGTVYLASPFSQPSPQSAAAPPLAPAATQALPPAQKTAQAPPVLPAAPAQALPANHGHQSSPVMAQGAPPAQTSPQTVASQAASPQTALPAGDAQAGRLVYRKCQACHSLESGKNTLGPSLAGIFGKKAGEVPNFNYSPALKSSNIVWDAAALDAYLLDPQKAVPGNKMPFPGLKTENERKDVIAYMAASSVSGTAQVAQRPPAPASSPVVAPAPSAQPPAPSTAAQAPVQQAARPSVSYIPDVRYTLRSGIAEGRMVYLGVGGTIEGQVNPILSAAEGQVVQITLINGEGAEHDIVFPEQDAKSPRITGRGASTSVVFRATRPAIRSCAARSANR
jgi:nitrite reductase (NO-forming)